ncbi:MAG: DUF3347 domain-containing protein, partial [Planctomycetota bacterium]
KISDLRRDFLDFSLGLIEFIQEFGHTYSKPLYVFHCPMYRHKLGGDWIQTAEKVDNPYMKPSMRGCGRKIETLPPRRQPK